MHAHPFVFDVERDLGYSLVASNHIGPGSASRPRPDVAIGHPIQVSRDDDRANFMEAVAGILALALEGSCPSGTIVSATEIWSGTPL